MDRRKLLQLGLLTTAGTLLPDFSNASGLWQIHRKHPHTAIRLNANENVYGPSEGAKKAIIESMAYSNRYPFRGAIDQLKKTIAKHHQVDEDMIFITAGSLQSLKVIGTRLGIDKGNHVAADLCFTPMLRQAEQVGCTWNKIPVDTNKGVDLNGLKNAINDDTRFVYLVNPNNPTGSYIERDKVLAFCKEVSAKVPVVLDEAYIEFVTGDESASLIPELKTMPNLIIVRTFSKIYGLAGLRIGYTLADPKWVEDWKNWDQNVGIGVTNVSAMAAVASLKDKDFVRMSKTNIDATRKRTVNALHELGIKTYPSTTNFILADSIEFEKQLIPVLKEKEISIAIGMPSPMKGLTRISIGKDDEMDILINVIKSVV